jgi:hypothetical protein
VIEASCNCGAVRVTCGDAPNELTDCNCTLCRRYGVNRFDVVSLPSITNAICCDADRRRDPAPINTHSRNSWYD